MSDGPQIDQGALNFQRGIGGGATAGVAGGGTQTENIANGIVTWIAKLTGIDLTNIQGPAKSLSVQEGLVDKKIMPKSGLSIKRENGFAATHLGPHITRDLPNMGDAPVGGGAPIEAPQNNVSFADIAGPAGSHGSFSVADVAGGPPTSSNAPNLGGGNGMMLS